MTDEMIAVFDDPYWDYEKQPEFVKDVFSTVEGITKISLHRYEFSLQKGVVFEWKEILPKILFILKMHFENEVKEKASPIRYDIDKEGFRKETR